MICTIFAPNSSTLVHQRNKSAIFFKLPTAYCFPYAFASRGYTRICICAPCRNPLFLAADFFLFSDSEQKFIFRSLSKKVRFIHFSTKWKDHFELVAYKNDSDERIQTGWYFEQRSFPRGRSIPEINCSAQ